ncbi:MAG TPA: hypothetical protein VGO06_14290 [Bosea sp. (in: a-proteobacteria)]|jgi:hypothetical protein|uniref:hypothetical protein n=1 Tax=Bosea sp. (in: a-proteobacteria) TaxID=1871050 RepID=UPI002E12F580|nr:hypothetical protein [Bosea sp. (in: a-proteobacteria)]
MTVSPRIAYARRVDWFRLELFRCSPTELDNVRGPRPLLDQSKLGEQSFDRRPKSLILPSSTVQAEKSREQMNCRLSMA